MIEVLDFRTILTCIKALLFDKTLIVFSYETSLLFQVVEGLKQLIFPFTVDFQQFLPANDMYKDSNGITLKELFEELNGMQPVIFAINSQHQQIEISHFADYPDAIILDIDASFVMPSDDMNETLPEFPTEIEFLKLLNRIKNKMLDNYDKIYPERSIPSEYDKENFIVQQIRELFFTKFLPFIKHAYLSIDLTAKTPKVVNEFWDKNQYL